MPLAFKVDENLPAEVADLLRDAGHDATTVLDQHLGGGDDDPLADLCRREGRALVTLDLDFADIRRYPPERYAGLIVLRPTGQDVPTVLRLVRALLPSLPLHPLAGRLWVVSEAGIRLRPAD